MPDRDLPTSTDREYLTDESPVVTTGDELAPVMATYDEAVAFLWSRINFERNASAPYTPDHFRLDRMREILHHLGDPHDAYPIVHVAGTKGKGTLCTLLAAALQASGMRTGLYTSPHFHRIEERFVVNGVAASEAEMVDLTREVAGAAEIAAMRGYGVATFFELTTAMGMLHFARQNVDIAVLEVGLGGRLDSTNVCRPICCAITSISLDHQRQLGNTIAQIAREKAGIIKPGVPVILAVRDPVALATIQEVARQQSAPTVVLGHDFETHWQPVPFCPEDSESPTALNTITLNSDSGKAQPCAVASELPKITTAYTSAAAAGEQRQSTDHPRAGDGNQIGVEDEGGEDGPRHQSGFMTVHLPTVSTWPSRLLGAHQSDNVAAAIAVLNVLHQRGISIQWDAAHRAIAKVRPRGRLEIVGFSPIQIIDSAHNPASIAAGLQALDDHFLKPRTGEPNSVNRSLIAVFASSRDKDYHEMIQLLLGRCEHLILTQYQLHSRAIPATELLRAAEEAGAAQRRTDDLRSRLHCVPVAEDAWETALKLASPNDVIWATGSLFLAAELLANRTR